MTRSTDFYAGYARAIADATKRLLILAAVTDTEDGAAHRGIIRALDTVRALTPAAPAPSPEPARWRLDVVKFADAMERKLRANDHKSHWTNEGFDGLDHLLGRIREELEELSSVAGVQHRGEPIVLDEAADVANFAMMIADVCDSLHGHASAKPAESDLDRRMAGVFLDAKPAKCARCGGSGTLTDAAGICGRCCPACNGTGTAGAK
jgi:hypothetical protein